MRVFQSLNRDGAFSYFGHFIVGPRARLSQSKRTNALLVRIFCRNLGAIARPQRVERAGLVDALVGVGTEEVALALDDGSGQAVRTQSVVVRQ